MSRKSLLGTIFVVMAVAMGASASSALAVNNPTTTVVTSSPNPSQFGGGVTFTATISLTPPVPGGWISGGGVQFFVDGAPFGSVVAVTPGNVGSPNGVATLSTSTLSRGTH